MSSTATSPSTPSAIWDAAGITARTTPADRHTPEQKAAAVLQDTLAGEFLGASAYLFAVPVYNYSMPSVFKAWLDHIMIVGRTIGLADATPTAGRPANAHAEARRQAEDITKIINA